MSKSVPDDRSYWRIDGHDDSKLIFRRVLPLGMLSNGEIVTLLQRLACRGLSEDEIIDASLRKNARNYAPSLECNRDHGARRHTFVCGTGRYHYIASVFSAAELKERGQLPDSK